MGSGKLGDGDINGVPAVSSLEANFQSVPPLGRSFSDKQMVEIAAEEHAQRVAKESLKEGDGLPSPRLNS